MKPVNDRLVRLWKDEEGVGTLELLLLLAVIVIIAIAFRKWILKWVGDLFKNADTQVNDQIKADPSVISPPNT